MGWREKTHPLHSRAEYVVYRTLKRAGLRGLLMDMDVTLKKELDGETEQFQTHPDYYLFRNDVTYLIYLDGPPHLKSCVEIRDEEVTEWAERKPRFKVLRYPYRAPLSGVRMEEIVADILAKVEVKE